MKKVDRPSEQELLARAVADLAAATRFPVAFGGLESGGAVTIASLVGTRTHSLDGLKIRPDRGLGGAAMAEARPRIAGDYRTARNITDDYDVEVLQEGIATLLAVPVVVDGRTRGILYGGSHAVTNAGQVEAPPALRIADALGRELQVRDEVARRLAEMTPEVEDRLRSGAEIPVRHQEELRESYAELRSISAGVDDPDLRARLRALEQRLAGLTDQGAVDALSEVRLSPREIDVLACAALGYRNAEIGHALGLTPGTIKGYLSTAMAKLDASTRHAAVSAARMHGIIP